NLQFFAPPGGNNLEAGFQRAIDVVTANIDNGIFRPNANLIIVTISNEDDTSTYVDVGGGNMMPNNAQFNSRKADLLSLVNPAGPLKAESLRYLALVPHQNCHGFLKGTLYKRMSQEIYTDLGHTDDGSHK